LDSINSRWEWVTHLNSFHFKSYPSSFFVQAGSFYQGLIPGGLWLQAEHCAAKDARALSTSNLLQHKSFASCLNDFQVQVWVSNGWGAGKMGTANPAFLWAFEFALRLGVCPVPFKRVDLTAFIS
jgi:hypothetical protein